MAASLLPDSTSCFFPCPLSFLFSSVPFLLTYLSCSPSQVNLMAYLLVIDDLFQQSWRSWIRLGEFNFWTVNSASCQVRFPCQNHGDFSDFPWFSGFFPFPRTCCKSDLDGNLGWRFVGLARVAGRYQQLGDVSMDLPLSWEVLPEFFM